MLLFCLLSAGLSAFFPSQQIITLEGLPLQLDWCDVDGDGVEDLVALMVISRTHGHMETYYDEGRLHGLYEDQTIQEQYLVTYTAAGGIWHEAQRIPLGVRPILGFLAQAGTPARLLLWKHEALLLHRWDSGWQADQRLATPGLLASDGAQMHDFRFWQKGPAGEFWLVPDLEGIHIIPASGAAEVFLTYPDFAVDSKITDEGYQALQMNMPRMIPLDGDAFPELVFQGDDRVRAWRLGETRAAFEADLEGILVDMNGDGLADRVVAEEEGDVERMGDLPKMTTRIQVYPATGPLKFSAEPATNQVIPGMLITDNDNDLSIELANPFIDLNGDKRIDLAGIALKLSFFQVAKVATTGHMTIKFLLQLSVQQENGRFKTLGNGPFEMTWKLNIRHLKMPAFAQMSADFDGDGWKDILMVKGRKLEVTPVTGSGFLTPRRWTYKLPAALSEPDQVYGRDLNGDGKCAFIAVVLDNVETRIGVMESGR